MKIARDRINPADIRITADAGEQEFLALCLTVAAERFREDARHVEARPAAQFITQAERAARIAYDIEGA